jgi:CheY-like chemotaxis protein
MANILIVDDRALNRNFLSTLIAYEGHAITEVADGGAALAAVGNSRPDLIFTDVVMAGIGGIELIERLHADAGTARIPLIVYTAADLSTEVRRMLGERRVIVLQKPSAPEAILATVRCVLGQAPRTRPSPALAPLLVADRPPFEAKQGGRDRVCMAGALANPG